MSYGKGKDLGTQARRPAGLRAGLTVGLVAVTSLTLAGCPQQPTTRQHIQPASSAQSAQEAGEARGTTQDPTALATAPDMSAEGGADLADSGTALAVGAGQVLPITAQLTVGSETIGLEVATTPQEQALGLMYRQELPDDRGMLFPINPPRPVSFWMRNVVIPLDMVFVHQGRIVAIEANVPPCTTPSCPTYGPGAQPVGQVIELAGGRAATLGLSVGDRLQVEMLPPPTPTPSPEADPSPESSPGS